MRKPPRNFNQTDVRVLFGAGAQTNAVILARSESKDQRHCYVSVDTRHDLLWKLVVFKSSHSALISFMCKVTALLSLLMIRPFVYLATCIFSCE